ncbi:MFS multidrug transporter [Aspergillus luchuensis]|uniref:MFS multidrug transporter n=1 Tax=Aspergillus kawachii TaxID=1069201 RepID=A0A146FL16_ASPKA|nr:MFS multidrug transporter [Aspergillus luchuensis]
MRAPRKQPTDGYRTSDSRRGRLEKEKVRHSDREVNRSESQDDDGRWLEVKQAETTVGSESTELTEGTRMDKRVEREMGG